MSLKDLCTAARQGNLSRLEALLAAGAPLEAEPGADSPLCYAAMYGQADAARLLLDRSANVNHRGAYGRTPLLYAAAATVAVTKLVLERGADLHARNESADAALEEHLTRDSAEPGIVGVLLAAGLDCCAPRSGRYYTGRTYLMYAASCGRLEAMKRLLAAGADPSHSPHRNNVLTAMEQSAETHRKVYPAMLSLIAHSGVDPNLEDTLFGTTLLMAVCKRGDLDSARTLIEAGANVNARGWGTPLTMAEKSGNQALVDFLLERGAVPSVKPLPPEVTQALDEADAQAQQHPHDGAARARRATTLATHGFHALAAHEVALARRLGVDAPRITLENPPGTVWELIATPPDDAVAPRQRDGWVRGVLAQRADGKQAPVVLVKGRWCTRCDEQGEQVCSSCGGSGWTSGQLSDTDDSPCDRTQRCSTCQGTKYQQGVRFSSGPCAHPKSELEVEFAGVGFYRCSACGLLGLGERAYGFACAACGLLDCTCSR